MDKKALEFFKKLLLDRKAVLLKQAAETIEETCHDSDTGGGDFADLASLESNRALILRIRDRERKLLAKIDEALAKIERGVYGICEVCGADIGVERLKVRPVATMCIACKKEQEEQEAKD